MLKILLIKFLKNFSYVQNLETKIEQLKAVETRLREEKGNAVVEKNKAAFKLEYLEAAVIHMIEQPYMVLSDAEGRFISIDADSIDKNENKYIKCAHTFPMNRIVIRVKEGREE